MAFTLQNNILFIKGVSYSDIGFNKSHLIYIARTYKNSHIYNLPCETYFKNHI